MFSIKKTICLLVGTIALSFIFSATIYNKVFSAPNYSFTPLPIPNNSYKNNFKLNIKKEIPTECSYLYGFGFCRDDVKSRVFICDIIQESSAQKNGLQVGDEILRINNQKIKNLNYVNLQNIINNTTSITLLIKNNNKKKKLYNLTKTKLCTLSLDTNNQDSLFDTYWLQIYTGQNIEDSLETISKYTNISNKLSKRTKQNLAMEFEKLNYWKSKKIKFENSYNSCKITTKSNDDLHACLIKSVSQLKQEIAYEQELMLRNAYIRAQQQLQIQQIRALNNYANALRYQNINVNHNGTFNVNHSIYYRPY